LQKLLLHFLFILLLSLIADSDAIHVPFHFDDNSPVLKKRERNYRKTAAPYDLYSYKNSAQLDIVESFDVKMHGNRSYKHIDRE
jgi:hypothetical protein